MFFNNRCCCGRRPCCCCNQPVGIAPVLETEVPITEPIVNKFVETETVHQVPHICPVHTHQVNKHIYKHSYTPQYTFSEEEVVVNEDCGSCCGF